MFRTTCSDCILKGATRRRLLSVAACLWLSLIVGSVQGATVLLQTDFQSLTTGASVNAADLNGATTGGTWFLNPTRGATYTVEEENANPGPAGDKAIVLDDTTTSGMQNVGDIQFGSVSLTSAADFSTQPVIVNFRTATRRTQTGKGLRYTFLNDNTAVATLDWEEGNDSDVVTLTGIDTDSGTSNFEFLNSWIFDGVPGGVRDVSLTFSGTTLDLEFIDLDLDGGGSPSSASLSVSLGSSVIDQIQFDSIGDSVNGARGIFLDDIAIIQVPEPGTLMMGLLGSLGLIVLTRRKQ